MTSFKEHRGTCHRPESSMYDCGEDADYMVTFNNRVTRRIRVCSEHVGFWENDVNANVLYKWSEGKREYVLNK